MYWLEQALRKFFDTLFLRLLAWLRYLLSFFLKAGLGKLWGLIWDLIFDFFRG